MTGEQAREEEEEEEGESKTDLSPIRNPLSVVSGSADIEANLTCLGLRHGGFPSVGARGYSVSTGKWFYEVTYRATILTTIIATAIITTIITAFITAIVLLIISHDANHTQKYVDVQSASPLATLTVRPLYSLLAMHTRAILYALCILYAFLAM